ncbi:MAG TPA: GGDEF domain-containing protein [Methylomusa anaerophila]|uniref:Putative diguanylate cyclase YcdT n=1 Tax=Methylomusa anaerophila TaxID=1930071 RepID=A0A348AEH3_9FIRM|nr:GGDEF domain-containing protein [Methylomusa anaerophila]BBB89471.1 putative diguanylate cyclase YcdT [Methylomusa anaerophila]HML89703.1 GGDEF domain-containing protein [Methylomusa anaerophila]
MKINTKLKSIMLLSAILPLFVVIVVGRTELARNYNFDRAAAIGMVTAILLGLLGPKLVERWLVTGSLAKIKDFCRQVKQNKYDGFDGLPNEEADSDAENEFISLMRDMNWMAHQIKCREQQLETTINDLTSTRSELLEQKQALEAANTSLLQMAMTDWMTKLPNRRHFFDHLEREMCRRNRNIRSISLIIIDVDHFKRVNDCYGHQVGDSVLIELAAVLQQGLRLSDLAARIGGEEFCLLLSDTGWEETLAVALRMQETIRNHVFHDCDGNVLQITCSMGMVHDRRPAAAEPELLYRYADRALYAAKEAGRNRVCYYDLESGVQPVSEQKISAS